jgi:DNA helicase-2/ATP-dependent DNA helicase PcrA
MVDEFQDTNGVQEDIVGLLTRRNGNVMAVGDDAQSIYGFRGANHLNILDFPKRFPGCRVIRRRRTTGARKRYSTSATRFSRT